MPGVRPRCVATCDELQLHTVAAIPAIYRTTNRLASTATTDSISPGHYMVWHTARTTIERSNVIIFAIIVGTASGLVLAAVCLGAIVSRNNDRP